MSKIQQKWVIQTILRDGNVCLYCKKELKYNEITLDHIVPKSLGGREINNLAVSCLDCNRLKGSLLLTEFLNRHGIELNEKIARYL